MKGVDELHKRYADKGLLAASVVVQNRSAEPATPADAALWTDGLELSLAVWADTTGAFFKTYDPKSILPMAYLIDRDGVIAVVDAGTAAEKVAKLEETIQRLLAD